jgi:chromosome segregation ATPase
MVKKDKNTDRRLLISVVAGIVALALGFGIGTAKGTAARKGAEKKHKAAIQKITTLEQQVASLQKAPPSFENARLQMQQQLEEVQKAADAARADAGRNARTVKSLNERVTTLENEKKDLGSRLAAANSAHSDLEKKHQQTTATLRDRERDAQKLEADKKSLQGKLEKTAQTLEQCSANNARLVGISQELVGRYRDKGVTDSIMHREPLTKLQRVELEKLVEQYKGDIAQQRFKK